MWKSVRGKRREVEVFDAMGSDVGLRCILVQAAVAVDIADESVWRLASLQMDNKVVARWRQGLSHVVTMLSPRSPLWRT